jgi:hypothetical protein
MLGMTSMQANASLSPGALQSNASPASLSDEVIRTNDTQIYPHPGHGTVESGGLND